MFIEDAAREQWDRQDQDSIYSPLKSFEYLFLLNMSMHRL